MKKTFNADTIRNLQLFRKCTSVNAVGLISSGRYYVFVIPRMMAPKAIGKEGKNIKQIKLTLKKEIKVMEEADSPEQLIKNFLFPVKLKEVVIVEDGQQAELQFLNRKDRRVLLSNQQELLKCLKDVTSYFYPDIKEIKVL